MKTTDWKQLSYQLAGALQFALNHLHARGTDLVMNMETMSSKTWQRYFAEELAKVPGMEIDWEAIDALSLPPKQRRAFFAKREKEKSTRDTDPS